MNLSSYWLKNIVITQDVLRKPHCNHKENIYRRYTKENERGKRTSLRKNLRNTKVDVKREKEGKRATRQKTSEFKVDLMKIIK